MTVQQMIEVLSGFNPDLEVFVDHEDWWAKVYGIKGGELPGGRLIVELKTQAR